jgi:6,7-dimethyl-8-ribityllumazine synthase
MAGRAPRAPDPAASPTARGRARFALVASRFHEPISKALVDGALAALVARGVRAERVDVHWVPGSFELPQAALVLARSRRYAAIACLGVVIRGGTPHFEHVSRETAAGIQRVALATGVPVTFGVITALTEEQAWERAGGAVGHRGEEAALAALEMAEWLPRARGGPRRA